MPRPDPHEPQFPGAARLANAAENRKPLVFLFTFPFLKFYFNDLNDHIRVKNPLFKPFVWLSGLFFILCEAALELFAVIMKWVSEVKRDACSVSSSLHTSVMTLLSSLSHFLSLAIVCVCCAGVYAGGLFHHPQFLCHEAAGCGFPQQGQVFWSEHRPSKKKRLFHVLFKVWYSHCFSATIYYLN